MVVLELQFFDGRFFPVVTQRLIPLVQTALKILEIPQLQYIDKLVVAPVVVYRAENCGGSAVGVR